MYLLNITSFARNDSVYRAELVFTQTKTNQSKKSCLRFFRGIIIQITCVTFTLRSGYTTPPLSRISEVKARIKGEEQQNISRNDQVGREEKEMRQAEKKKEKSWRGMRFVIARGAPERCLMMTHGKTNCGSNGLSPQLAGRWLLLLPCCVKLQ